MRKLDELIEKLCPNGVEYKQLNQVCDFKRGTSISSKTAIKGNIPVISGGQKPAFYHNTSNRPVNTITIAGSGAYAGYVAFWEEPIFCADAFSVEIKDEKVLNKKYLYHYLLNNQNEIYNKKTGAGIPHVHGKDISRFYIPVPPLEMQCKIVYILDNLSELYTELSEQLSEELKAREKQYEYYKDKLLSKECKNKVNLGSLCKIITKGTTPSAFSREGIIFIKTEAFEKGFINKNKLSYISDEIHNGKLKRSILEENDILFTIAGATIGKMAVVTKDLLPANTNQALAIIRLNYNVNIKYIKFILSSNYMKEYIQRCVKGSAQPNLNLQQLNEFTFPFPEKEQQEKIVKILEKLDIYTNDISVGLPAEIEARKKQYEYYRDKLLTFKELKVNE